MVIQGANGLAPKGTPGDDHPGWSSPGAAHPGDTEAGGQQIPRRGRWWRAQGGSLPTLGSACQPAAHLQSQPCQLPPLPPAFSCPGPLPMSPLALTLLQAPPRPSQIHLPRELGAALLSLPLPLCSPWQLLLPDVSPPSPQKPRPTRWGPNLHPLLAAKVCLAHGPAETCPAKVSACQGSRRRRREGVSSQGFLALLQAAY